MKSREFEAGLKTVLNTFTVQLDTIWSLLTLKLKLTSFVLQKRNKGTKSNPLLKLISEEKKSLIKNTQICFLRKEVAQISKIKRALFLPGIVQGWNYGCHVERHKRAH